MTNFKKIFKFICRLIFALLLFLIIYSAFIEPKLLTVKHLNLYLPNYNSEHNGLKVAIISDLHIGRQGINEKQLVKIVSKTNREKPDLIFLLGDYDSLGIYYSKKINPDNVSRILSELKAKYGVYSILGNHDYDTRLLIKPIIKEAGIKILENDYEKININSKPLNIYGLRDLWHFDYNPELIDKAQKSVIVLTHNPDTFPLLPDNIAIALAGHTHGGQIYLPFTGAVFSSSMYNQRFIKGYVVENNKHIYITSGIGNIGPFRFGNIPEIVILTLYSQNDFPKNKIMNTKPRTGRNFKAIPLEFVAQVRKYYKPVTIN